MTNKENNSDDHSHPKVVPSSWQPGGPITLASDIGIVTVLPAVVGANLLIRANGLASIGLGLFGGLIALIPFRRGEAWAWLALWFYPIFWFVHLVDELPPGKDHIHQIAFIVLSLAGLLLPVRDILRPDRQS